MDMGWVHPWVGLGWVGSEIFVFEMGWVGFSFSNLIIFFSITIIQLRKSVAVVYPYRIQYRVNSSAN